MDRRGADGTLKTIPLQEARKGDVMNNCVLDVINFGEMKAIFMALEEISDEVCFDVHERGIEARVLDRSHISMMDIKLTNSWFGTYNCLTPNKYVLETNELKRLISKIKDNDKVRIEFNESGLNFIIKNEGYIVLKIDKWDTELDFPTPPDVEHSGNMNFNLLHLVNAIKTLSGYCQDLEFYFDGNHLMIGNDGNESKLYGRPWQREGGYTKLSIDKLIPIVKAVNFSKRVDIDYGTDKPMRFNLQSGRKGGNVYFLIAPKIEKKDESCESCPGEEEEVCTTCNGDD